MRLLLALVLRPRLLSASLAAALVALAYVWVASVHALPRVRRRKAAARVAWRGRARRRP